MQTSQPHITVDPAVRDGRPCVEGTTIRVTEVAAAAREGRSAAALQEYFAHSHRLTLAEVYAALTYYEDHSDELAAVLEEDLRAEARAEEERLDKIRRHFMGLP